MNNARHAPRTHTPASGSVAAAARGATADPPTAAQAIAAFAAFAPLLESMSQALRTDNPATVQEAAGQLQAGLAPLQSQLQRMPASELALQRAQLAQISAQIQSQRQALARAQAAAQRRAELLLPAAPGHAGYGAHGANERGTSTGAVQA